MDDVVDAQGVRENPALVRAATLYRPASRSLHIHQTVRDAVEHTERAAGVRDGLIADMMSRRALQPDDRGAPRSHTCSECGTVHFQREAGEHERRASD